MPLYDYMCPECGPFEALAPMSSSAAPCTCPDCSVPSPRVILTAPAISAMAGSTRRAHETNERSADSPKRSAHGHGPGCGCCGGSSKSRSATLHRPDGSKSFPSKRPWMISH